MAITKAQRIEGKGVERVGKGVRGFFFFGVGVSSPFLIITTKQSQLWF
jgi:hypothetical protein